MRFAGGLGRVSLASSPFQGRNSQKGSQLKKAAFHVETSKNITNVLYSTLDMIETKVTILEPPKKNAHMSHYSESIFFQSRCAATRLNRNKPIKASGICGSQGHWRRKSWWEKRSRGKPTITNKESSFNAKNVGSRSSFVVIFITLFWMCSFIFYRGALLPMYQSSSKCPQQTPRSKTLAVLQTLAASQGNLVIKQT